MGLLEHVCTVLNINTSIIALMLISNVYHTALFNYSTAMITSLLGIVTTQLILKATPI